MIPPVPGQSEEGREMNVREKMAKAIGVVITRSERVEPKGEWLKAADAALDVMREPSVGGIAAAI